MSLQLVNSTRQVVLTKLIIHAFVKKLPAFYGTSVFITVLKQTTIDTNLSQTNPVYIRKPYFHAF